MSAVSVYLPDELHERLLALAETEHRSLSGQIIHILTGQVTSKSRAARATRLPDDFAVTADMIAWAKANTPSVGRLETENFIDYWRSASGQNARKLDWVAAWRNWMRKAERNSGGTIRSREQRETDAMFDRAMERARWRDAAGESSGSRLADTIRSRALPSAED